MRLQGTFDLSRCTPHERHYRTSVARRTHRNGEPSFGAYQHKDHPDLRQCAQNGRLINTSLARS